MGEKRHIFGFGLTKRLTEAADLANGDDHPIDHFTADTVPGRIVFIPIRLLRANPDQPRKKFDERAHEELTASIKELGIIEPLIARKDAESDGYILISGERRLRAAVAAGLTQVPAIVRTDENAREVAIVENVQREDLDPLELAEGLRVLKEERGYTDQDLARVIGKSRKSVNDALQLVLLPDDIKTDWRTSAIGSKSQLLEIMRAGSPEKVRAAWEALKAGETRTVKELRKRSREAKGRPKAFTFTYASKTSGFRLSLSFKRARVTPAEVRAALAEVLEQTHHD